VLYPVIDSMVLMEFAGCNRCIAELAEYAVDRVQVQLVKHESGALVYLVIVEDALWLNKQILELGDLCDKGIADRIDFIQVLENLNLPMVESPMDCFIGKIAF
jgi:hypothetical protein